jgi:RNA polymerase sigma factor (sigma-70 family)
LFERHRPGVASVCRGLLDPAEAEDALQQTFLSAYLAIARRGERPRRLHAWLRSIARNECHSQLRRRRLNVPMPDELADELSAADDVVAQQAEVRGMVADVRELPPDQRAALVLSELDDLPHREIAQSLDCPPGKVKALVFQARSRLSGLRAARDLPCERVREQVSRKRVGRPPAGITRHLQACAPCAEYARQVREERHGMILLLPLGAAVEWVRSLFGAGGVGAKSAAAATGGVATGSGTAVHAGLAKLGILVIAGGAAAGAGAGGFGSIGEKVDPAPPVTAPGGSDPAEGVVSGGAAYGVPAAEAGAEGGLASGRRRSITAGEAVRARGEQSGHRRGRERGGPTGSPPVTPDPPRSPNATGASSSSSPSQAASRPAPGPEGNVGRPESTAASEGAPGPMGSQSRPAPGGSQIPGVGRPPNVGGAVAPDGCPAPAPPATSC